MTILKKELTMVIFIILLFVKAVLNEFPLILSSSGPGPGPVQELSQKLKKRTRAYVIKQLHPPPTPNFSKLLKLPNVKNSMSYLYVPCHISHDTQPMTYFTCCMSYVLCHISYVLCPMSHVLCPMSKSGEDLSKL